MFFFTKKKSLKQFFPIKKIIWKKFFSSSEKRPKILVACPGRCGGRRMRRAGAPSPPYAGTSLFLHQHHLNHLFLLIKVIFLWSKSYFLWSKSVFLWSKSSFYDQIIFFMISIIFFMIKIIFFIIRIISFFDQIFLMMTIIE